MAEGEKAARDGSSLGKAAEGLIMGALALTALIGVIIGLAMIRGICGPINTMSGVMRKLAGGQLEADVPNRGDKTEIGDMAGAVQVFKDNLIHTRELEADAVAARAPLARPSASRSWPTSPTGSNMPSVPSSKPYRLRPSKCRRPLRS